MIDIDNVRFELVQCLGRKSVCLCLCGESSKHRQYGGRMKIRNTWF